jgi:hypothetical protein
LLRCGTSLLLSRALYLWLALLLSLSAALLLAVAIATRALFSCGSRGIVVEAFCTFADDSASDEALQRAEG